MEMKLVGLVELLQGRKASSFVCELEWKKLNCGMGKNTVFLVSFCKDTKISKIVKEVDALHELFPQKHGF